jgi:phosphatidylinositol alpha-1,6-mannosyltransferase
MAADEPPGRVVFAGQVSEAELPRYYRAGDVFAMPCRTRRGGLEVEGWGTVFIEAAACARPVVVGDSGGAREALLDGATGLLVDGTDVRAVGGAVADLLADPDRAERSFTWTRAAEQLAGWLREAAA